MQDVDVFSRSYFVELGRASETTLETKALASKPSRFRNWAMSSFINNGELDLIHSMLSMSLSEAATHIMPSLDGCGDYVFKNILNVLAHQCPEARFEPELIQANVKETWCGAGTNGKDFAEAAQCQQSITEFYKSLPVLANVMQIVLRIKRQGRTIRHTFTPAALLHLQQKAWVKQLTACKTMQLIKVSHLTGSIRRPRRVRAEPVSFVAALQECQAS